jgi:hypothetical protein
MAHVGVRRIPFQIIRSKSQLVAILAMYQNLKAAGSWIKSQLSRQPGTHSYTQSEQWLE